MTTLKRFHLPITVLLLILCIIFGMNSKANYYNYGIGEAMSGLQLGWHIRGIEDAKMSGSNIPVDLGLFKQKCIQGDARDYDNCRVAIGDITQGLAKYRKEQLAKAGK